MNKPMASHPRGSILIFALILLILLAGLGTVFMLTAQLEGKATSNALKNSQADEAMEAGIAHAKQMIFQGVSHYQPVSPDGIYVNDPAKAFLDTDCNKTVATTTPNFSYIRAFEGYDNQLLAAQTAADSRGHAFLWWNNTTPAYYMSSSLLGTTNDLRYTERTATTYSTYNGVVNTYYPNGPEHAGLARKFTLGQSMSGSAWDDFYNTSLVQKPFARVPILRGDYYIWVADLDGKLYYDPKDWGLTPMGNWPGTTTPAPEDEKDLASEILLNTITTAGLKTPATSFWGKSATAPSSMAELFEQFGLTFGAGQEEDFYNTRYGLDRYFTVIPETAAVGSQFVKQHPYALNVNTANLETITAVLSRIPLVDGYDPANAATVTENKTKASALATRICAMRPFLGRMDFEDFLASHLNNTVPLPSAAVAGDIDPFVAATPDQSKFVGLIYSAIAKRPLLDTDPTNAQLYSDIKYMGLDPAQVDLQAYAANPYIINISQAATMQARFAMFRTLPSTGPLEKALLSLKAFNNVLNSLSGRNPRTNLFEMSYYSEDKVVFTVGAGTEAVVPDKPFAYSHLTSDMVAHTVTPKLLYNKLLQAELTALPAGQKMYVNERGDLSNATEPGELLSWKPTATSGYYEFAVDTSLDQQLYEYGASFSPPNPLAATPVINGDTTTGLHTPEVTDDQVAGTDIVDPISGDHICNTTIHAPVRAYRHAKDAATGAPSCAKTDGVNGDGDVAWSPRFDFRSRFFMIYVLANDLRPDKSGTPTPGTFRRVEALYDALSDKILWRRSPVSEKRSLGNP